MTGTLVGAAASVKVPPVLNAAVEYVDGAVAAGHGDRVAYIHEERRLTYVELQARVNQVGNALAGLGLEIEQRVTILLPNCPEFVTSFFGALKIGAVPTPMSYESLPMSRPFSWPTAGLVRSSPQPRSGSHSGRGVRSGPSCATC